MDEPIYAIGYARVSSPRQAQHGEGLDDQSKAINYFIKQQNWTLYPDEVLEEQFTGKANQRPLYDYAVTPVQV